MMNFRPEINIVRVVESYIYIKNILKWTADRDDMKKHFSGLDLDSLIRDMDDIVDPLRTEVEKYEQSIMDQISERTGFRWDSSVPCISVYPIPFFNSFSHPLFLKVCRVVESRIIPREIGLSLGMLIHELIHNNIKKIPVTRDVQENIIHRITLDILDSIKSKYTATYIAFHKKIGKPLDDKGVPGEIIRGEQTIREYYKIK